MTPARQICVATDRLIETGPWALMSDVDGWIRRVFRERRTAALTHASARPTGAVTSIKRNKCHRRNKFVKGRFTENEVRRPAQRRKQARPAEILEAAIEEFSLRGFAAARLDDIAKRAGISKGLIYAYFPSKEDLFLAVLKETGPVFDKVVELAAEPQGSAVALLKTLFDFFAFQIVENRRGREATRIMFAEGGRYPEIVDRWHDDVMTPAFESVRKIVRYGIARGEFRADAPESFPHLFWSSVHYAVHWTNVFGSRHSFDSDQMMADALETNIRALRPLEAPEATPPVLGRRRRKVTPLG